jgi:hypothetical protein
MAQESAASIEVTPRIRLRDRVIGHMRRQFLGEYRMLRKAGVNRDKALSLCLQRYGKRDTQ